MSKFKDKDLMWLAFLILIVPATVRAAETVVGTINTPNNDAYSTAPGVSTTTLTHPTAPKPHRRHKKSANSSTVVPSSSSIPTKEPPASNTNAPGMSDSLGTNTPGSPNLGPSDHAPGTTGTSGQ